MERRRFRQMLRHDKVMRTFNIAYIAFNASIGRNTRNRIAGYKAATKVEMKMTVGPSNTDVGVMIG